MRAGASGSVAGKSTVVAIVRAPGFTLLEIMLALLVMGLATSVVLPTMMPADSARQVRKMTRTLVTQLRSAQEIALVEGVDLALVRTPEYYQFLSYGQGGWKPIRDRRLLRRTALPEGVQLRIEAGDSLWRSALEAEQQQGSGLVLADEADRGTGNGIAYAFENGLEKNADDAMAFQSPNLYIRASGELTPAELRFFVQEHQGEGIILEESGRIELQQGAP